MEQKIQEQLEICGLEKYSHGISRQTSNEKEFAVYVVWVCVHIESKNGRPY